LTQEELAERSGVSVRAIADVESGRTARPHRQSVRLIARALNLAGPENDAFCAAGRGPAVEGEHRLGAGQAELLQDGRRPTGGPHQLLGEAGIGPAVPRQLPAAVPDFTGRTTELEALTQILDDANPAAPGTVVVAAIGGMAGVGKTTLALHWAHQVAGRFPGGQLYVNLRGFDRSGAPVTAAEAIRGFLEALGVPPEQAPPSPQAQAGLYRSLLADRRMLIVADNAGDEDQVRPLLPGSAGTLMLVTSRSQLAGLAAADGARLLSLDVLSEPEARQLLAARIDRTADAAEDGAVAEIANLCAYLPLALTVAAARIAARPGLPLAALAAELRHNSGRLDALDTGDPAGSVRAVFSWSIRQLSCGAARLFRLLGLHPGPDITAPAAASLAGCQLAQACQHLSELARAHLVGEHIPGRYTLHDLLCAYAAEQAHAVEDQQARHAATGRALDHYLHTAHRAAVLIKPARDPIAIGPPRPGVTPEHLADLQQARAWFEVEHRVLLAAATLAASTGFDIHAWQIPWTMANFMDRRGHWHLIADVQDSAVAAATRLGDTAGQAESLRLLALACTRLGNHGQALTHTAASLRLCHQLGDLLGEASAYFLQATVAESQGNYTDALADCEQALRLYQAADHRPGQARMLNNIAWDHDLLGDYQQARLFCQQSLTLTAELGLRDVAAAAWHTLGYAEHNLGNLAQADTCYRRALSIYQELGDRFQQALTLTHHGDTHQQVGEHQQAHDAWQRALEILDELHHPDAGQIRAKLANSTKVGADTGA
jgi:tetratricopeptide (TPR) repeat protein